MLKIFDSRTKQTYSVTIDEQKCIAAAELKDVKVLDPSLLRTAIASSAVSFVDGVAGRLTIRGYDIDELAARSSFLEASFLTIFGELPTAQQGTFWEATIKRHASLHQNLLAHIQSFRYDAHPISILISSLSALASFYPEANPALAGRDVLRQRRGVLLKQVYRLVAKMGTIAAAAFRHRQGRAFVPPRSTLSFSANLLYMMHRMDDAYVVDERVASLLDRLLLLHIEHSMNASTVAMLHVASTGADMFSCAAAATAALYGPLHGGANEACVKMLQRIGSVDRVASFVDACKRGDEKLMGFGHRVYKTTDPRARIAKRLLFDMIASKSSLVSPAAAVLVDVAVELERCALADAYFVQRSLFPNVDYWTGLIYASLGFPLDFFPVLFAVARAVGWTAHFIEAQATEGTAPMKIFRPSQKYVGAAPRAFVPVAERAAGAAIELRPMSTSSRL